jgi:putative oxidoreductase
MLRDIGLLLARGTIGLGFAAHGSQKAFGWFEGPGAHGAAGIMESLGFRPGTRYAKLSSATEIVAGLLVTLGFGGPVGPALVLSVMLVAQVTVHAKNGFFAQKGGVELGALYAAGVLALAMCGYGRLSIDEALALDGAIDERLIWAALLGGLVGGAAMLGQREPGEAPPPAA